MNFSDGPLSKSYMWPILLAALFAQPAAPVDVSGMSADEVFRKVTASTWYVGTRGKLVDFNRYTLRPDGTYAIEHITDFNTQPRTGKWNLHRDTAGEWFVCFDDGTRHRFGLAKDGAIRLSAMPLSAEGPQPRDPRYSAKTLPKFDLPADVRKKIDRLTRQGWKRANDFNLDYDPTSVRFTRDFRYEAVYRDGDCASRGAWFVSTAEARGNSTAGRCDKRSRVGDFGEGFRIEFPDGEEGLLLNDELYVSQDRPLKRGVVRYFIGYSQVTPIRLEYDLPIRAGVPTRFDFTVGNLGTHVLTLDRFSLTPSYHDYRNAQGAALRPPADELAAKDFGGAKLDPGKPVTFSIDVTFAQAAQQGVYFNFLVTGPTQAWDTHQHHQVFVRAKE